MSRRVTRQVQAREIKPEGGMTRQEQLAACGVSGGLTFSKKSGGRIKGFAKFFEGLSTVSC